MLKLRGKTGTLLVFLTFLTIMATGGCGGQSTMSGTEAGHDTSTSFASISATPQSGKSPLTVSFRAVDLAHAMFGAVTKYNWDFGDGAKAEDRTTEHTYTRKGKYTVTLTIFYQDGTQQVDKKTIEVK